ncbi:MAG: putative Ig domain-containing protein [Gammaproteobacteria bacterium]|nr:putative Ig domain-containing protein [Gammaproteobacteria bacterium]
MVDAEGSVDENDDGATIAAVTTENSTEVTVDDDRFEVADGNLKLKDGTSLDFEADTSPIEVTLTAVSEGDDATATVSVSINDVNEAPSIDVRDGEEVPGHAGVISNLTIDENVMRADAPPLALIEVMDPDAADADMLTGDAGVAATSVSDDRFAVILDPENGLWLHLAEGASLDHEAESEITVTVTYTDSAGNTASQDVTVMVADVNESPVAVGMVDTVTTESGKAIDVELDLAALFNDPDAGDADLRYELSGNPSWLSLTTDGRLRGEPPITGAESAAAHMVTITATDSGGEAGSVSFYVIVDDGNDEVTGINLLDDNGNSIVEVEVDESDASGKVFGEITVDDIDHPMHPNGMHQVTVSDRRFEIREVDGKMWLALKQGMSLDYEDDNGAVTVRVTAVDMNGELNDPRTAERTGEKYKGTSETVSFTVVITDENDAPQAQTIGNWWVTVDDDLEANQVSQGSWLKFQLETEDDGDTFPAFRDPDGDTLTYSISGPSWLEIDEDDGTITNADDAVPQRGVYRVTVTATDPDGASGSVTFNLNVALSGPGGNYTDDNEEPSIRVTSEPGYREGSNEVRVATFTVTDRDQDIPDHQFAISKVEIISVVNGADADGATDDRDATLRDHDSDPATPDRLWVSDAADTALDGATGTRDSAYEGYAGAFRLSDPIKSGNTWTYHIYARDTDSHPFVSTLTQLNHEVLDEIEITVRVTDGVGATDEETIDIDIDDVNEVPSALRSSATSTASTAINLTPTTLGVNQTEESKVVLYIKLFDVWSDDRDDDDDLSYGASTSGSWIKVRHIGEWGDIKDGPDGDANTADDLAWNPTDTAATDDAAGIDNRLIGTAGDPADGDVVAIVEIDRTTRDSQGDRGSLTLTARDDDSGNGSRTYNINPADQNVVIGDGAVRLSGSPREDGTLTASFNDNRDPDLGGSASPALVLYSWYRVTGDNGTPDDPDDDPETLIAVTTGNQYKPTQTDVGNKIKVSVSYYEVFGGRITGDDGGQYVATGGLTGIDTGGLETAGLGATSGGSARTSRDVSNTPDDGRAAFTITADTDTLRAEVYIRDGDYPTAGNRLDTKGDDSLITKWQWQVSDNGRGGWEDVEEADTDASTPDVNEALQDNILTLPNGDGKYYRVVVSYLETQGDTSANAPMEEIASQAIRIGNVDNNALPVSGAVPTISGSANPGGTLIVNGSGISSVQWQKREFNDTTDTESYWADIPGATGTSLSLTSAHAGDVLRAVVTYSSSTGATLVVLADGDTVTADVQPEVTVGGTVATVRPVAVKTEDDPYWIETSVSGTGHARWAHINTADTAGQTVSLMHTVPLASLFQDTDTPSFLLRFTAAGDTTTGLDADEVAGSTGTYEFANDHNLLVLELGNGKLTYVSDKLRGHDGTGGDAGDGLGNWLTLDITANDQFGASTGASQGTGEVRVRINVAPTDIDIEHPDATGNDASVDGRLVVARGTTDTDGTVTVVSTDAAAIDRVHLNENVRATGQEVLAVLDVQDENHARHSFGTHEITVSDDRFEITNTGDSVIRDGDGDGSTWQLRLKPGASFDFEADDQDGDRFNGITEFKITLMATDGGGLSTPEPHPESFQYIYLATWLYQPITLTVRIINDPDDDASRPLPSNVPGLKDDETTDPDDEREDDTTDGDVDGGRQPPPPGMSLGIIEDFVDNMMDYGDQDLLEDFLLTIDDGLDIV